jgi:hypothetical protein
LADEDRHVDELRAIGDYGIVWNASTQPLWLAGTKFQLLRWRYKGEEAHLRTAHETTGNIFGTGLGAYLYSQSHRVCARGIRDGS